MRIAVIAPFKRIEEYKRRRLGRVASADDAKRWALIAYDEFSGCILIRPVLAFLRHDRVRDTFLYYTRMMHKSVSEMPLEEWARYFRPLLHSEDDRLRDGALILLHPESGCLVVSDLVELAMQRHSGASWYAEVRLALRCREHAMEFLNAEINVAESAPSSPTSAARAKELRRLQARVVEILTTREFDESYPIKPGDTSAMEKLKSWK